MPCVIHVGASVPLCFRHLEKKKGGGLCTMSSINTYLARFGHAHDVTTFTCCRMFTLSTRGKNRSKLDGQSLHLRAQAVLFFPCESQSLFLMVVWCSLFVAFFVTWLSKTTEWRNVMLWLSRTSILALRH